MGVVCAFKHVKSFKIAKTLSTETGKYLLALFTYTDILFLVRIEKGIE